MRVMGSLVFSQRPSAADRNAEGAVTSNGRRENLVRLEPTRKVMFLPKRSLRLGVSTASRSHGF